MSSVSMPGFVPAHLNPFAIAHVTCIPYCFTSGNWESHLAKLCSMKFRGAIVGPQGSGKTTLLEQLNKQLSLRFSIQTHYLFLPQEKSEHQQMLDEALSASRKGNVLLVDGIERLSFFQRRKLYRNTRDRAGLVVNVHRKCQIQTWINCRPDLGTVKYLLEKLGHDTPQISAAAESYYGTHQGNIRDIFRSLYDDFSSGKYWHK